MYDAVLVRLAQAFGDLQSDVEGFFRRQRLAVDSLPQGFAFDILRRHERDAVGFADFINREDVRMIQARGGARLLQKAAAAFIVRHIFGRQDLERDLAVQLFIVRFIDRPHAARAERLKNAIMRDGRACGNGFCF